MGYKGVIKRVDQPTDWVNSLVTADKANRETSCVFKSQGFEQSDQAGTFSIT